jgi:hypothetical protein
MAERREFELPRLFSIRYTLCTKELDACPSQAAPTVFNQKEDAAAHSIRSGDPLDPSSAPPKW